MPSQPVLLIAALAVSSRALAAGLQPGQIKNLVTFGDSYTDVGSPADGGQAWPVYAASYSNTTLYPFARSGATCSNNITYRPFPSLFESQLPLYYEESSNGSLSLDPETTLYTLWIGTNDVGGSALLSASSGENASLVDVTECMVNWVKDLYDHGARNFLFQNMIPLELTPQYSPDSYPTRYWHLERNTTAWSDEIRQFALSGNKITQLLLQALAPTLVDGHVGIFDSHSFFNELYNNPEKYLNGTAPVNVTGSAVACVYGLNSDESTCTSAEGTDRDSYLWYDELHPSEQADRIVAENIAEVIEGKDNSYTTWLT